MRRLNDAFGSVSELLGIGVCERCVEFAAVGRFELLIQEVPMQGMGKAHRAPGCGLEQALVLGALEGRQKCVQRFSRSGCQDADRKLFAADSSRSQQAQRGPVEPVQAPPEDLTDATVQFWALF